MKLGWLAPGRFLIGLGAPCLKGFGLIALAPKFFTVPLRSHQSLDRCDVVILISLRVGGKTKSYWTPYRLKIWAIQIGNLSHHIDGTWQCNWTHNSIPCCFEEMASHLWSRPQRIENDVFVLHDEPYVNAADWMEICGRVVNHIPKSIPIKKGPSKINIIEPRGSVAMVVHQIQIFSKNPQQVMETLLGIWRGQNGVQQPRAQWRPSVGTTWHYPKKTYISFGVLT